MSDQDLINASKRGNFELVRSLLENKQNDINCKDILTPKTFLKFTFIFFFKIFEIIIIFKIQSLNLVTPL